MERVSHWVPGWPLQLSLLRPVPGTVSSLFLVQFFLCVLFPPKLAVFIYKTTLKTNTDMCGPIPMSVYLYLYLHVYACIIQGFNMFPAISHNYSNSSLILDIISMRRTGCFCFLSSLIYLLFLRRIV